MDQEITNIIKHLKEQAQKSMRKNDGELEPKMYFLILYPGQKTPVYFPIPCSLFFGSSEMKDMMPTYTQLCWEKKKATSPQGIELKAVCTITDAWMTKLPINKELCEADKEAQLAELEGAVRPSEDPNRVEVLMINICLPTESKGLMIPYIRSGRNIVFKDTVEDPLNTIGRMATLYPTV